MRCLILGYLLLSLQAHSQEIAGKKVQEISGLKLTDSIINLLVRPGQGANVSIAYLNGIKFHVLIDSTNTIRYLSNVEDSFFTSDGIRVGSSFKEIVKKFRINRNNMKRYPGWGYFIKLPSGWNAVFDFKRPVNMKSRVVFFFQDNL